MPIVYDKSRKIFTFAGWRYKLYYADCERKVSCTFVLGKTHFFIS